MNSWPKISIITPTFNQGQFIEQTILSVINQNYPNLEYIIIDGGSTDNTLDIIKKYEKYIYYWVSEPDNGQSDAINKGLKIATGEVVNWLNSDDYYEPGVLFVIADYFKRNTKINVLSGKSKLFKYEDLLVGYSNGSDKYKNINKTIGWARIDQPETFFRKSVLDKIGYIDSELSYIMDRDLWIKYLLNFGQNNVLKVGAIFVNFRLHDNSKTVLQQKKFQIEHNSWFYNFATITKNYKQSLFIEQNYNINKNYYIKNLPDVNQEKAFEILNYYILYKAAESYFNKNMQLTKVALSQINFWSLRTDDKWLWMKLFFKNNLLAQKFIALIRNK